ncbi:cupredoxin domain-containing protein [Streptomyces sp. NPDC096323]|uniref:cupredoxin domain-containing protein n=1 Tax=Streptomyces sp. NPDC096323 TaxID=3155822 RepID=UPI00331D6932
MCRNPGRLLRRRRWRRLLALGLLHPVHGGAVGSRRPDTIKDFAFHPAAPTVAPGTRVTVINKDGATHTVTATGNKAFDTGEVKSGQTVTFRAPARPGSYPYICTIHPTMHGSLTVR